MKFFLPIRSQFVALWLVIALSATLKFVVEAQQPMIFDADYGPFIDDIFALGLLLNSADLLDMRLILTTSEQPELSALCVAAQLKMSNVDDIPVAVGESFPPYEERGSVCAIPGILGFGIEPACRAAFNETEEEADLIENGVDFMAQMIIDSDRDDWWYIVVGGQTSLKRLIEEYPEAASQISTLIVMAGNFCADFEPYPGVLAPTDETNIGCDPKAANYVLDGNNTVFDNVYYVPVVVADEIGGEDYAIFVEAANSGEQPIATATLDFYKLWSVASRADPDLLVHAEAMTYDPETESTPQFDAMAVMLALEMLAEQCGEGRIATFEMDAIHFYETTDPGLAPFPDAPRSAYSLFSGDIVQSELPEQCPNITGFTFDPDTTPESEYPVIVALGFVSPEAKDAVYADMARRLAGEIVLCGVNSTTTSPPGGDGTDMGDTDDNNMTGGGADAGSSLNRIAPWIATASVVVCLSVM